MASGWSCLSSCTTADEPAVKQIIKKKPPANANATASKKKTESSSTTSSSHHPRLSVSEWSHTSSSTLSEDLSASLVGSNLYAFSLMELKVITNSFSTSNFLGEGGFGPVYKGFVDDKLRPGLQAQAVAVKLLDSDGLQGHKEWLTEVIFLGQLRHCHLVKLIGYCCEDQHRLLVYEYMPRGSLENQLFSRYSVPLSWSTRMKIAVEAAKGLAFLHEADKPVIYRDLKAANILLDSDYTVKLSDFGLAKDGPEGDDTHVSTRVMGTHGYAAPEYIMTGRLTSMSDVYSFGVVLLELLTGRKPADKHRPHREQNLVEWARPALNDVRKLRRILDPRLEGQYPDCGARTVASVAYQCLSQRPKQRPTMRTVVETLEPLLDFKDIFAVPIVFTFQDGELKKEEPKEKKEGQKSKEEEEATKRNGHSGHRNHHNHHHHRRHRDQVRPSGHHKDDGVVNPCESREHRIEDL